jgi:2-polyprenyl-3-methyl-5-hydroxy-6-metoxy-1,4-benzoquinol methylase
MLLITAMSEAWSADELEHLERCVVCDCEALEPLYDDLRAHDVGLWRLDRCSACGSALLNPRPTVEAIGKAYRGNYRPYKRRRARPLPKGRRARLRYAATNAYLRRRWGYTGLHARAPLTAVAMAMPGMRRAADRLVRFVPAPPTADARLLDVGCGSGTYLKLMRDLGWQVRGVELDEGAVRTARKAKLDVRQGTMDDLDPDVDGLFDVITVGHVIEHTHDPIAALTAARRVLEPGGMLWIGTPNLGSLGARLFRARWRALEPPRHLVIFTGEALTVALHRAGFTDVRPVRSTASAPWHFQQSAKLAGSSHLRLARVAGRVVNAGSYLRPTIADEMTFLATTLKSQAIAAEQVGDVRDRGSPGAGSRA